MSKAKGNHPDYENCGCEFEAIVNEQQVEKKKEQEPKEKFLAWAENNNWHVEYAGEELSINPDVLARYPHLPYSFSSFIGNLKGCISPDETAWILTPESFEPHGEDSWQYNEFELISLEACDGDEQLIDEAKRFWNSHCPILMSVGGGYEYCAVSMDDGSIVAGCEPEFEDSAEKVADSFDDFLRMIEAGDIVIDNGLYFAE